MTLIEETETERETFEITSPELAAWAADKVLSAREHLARVIDNCESIIHDAQGEVLRREQYFLPLLEAWARANPPDKGKTIKLPTGKLAFRTIPGRLSVTDQDAALAWSKQHYTAAVVIKESVSASMLLKHATETGEMPDGVESVPGRETFDVKG